MRFLSACCDSHGLCRDSVPATGENRELRNGKKFIKPKKVDYAKKSPQPLRSIFAAVHPGGGEVSGRATL